VLTSERGLVYTC